MSSIIDESCASCGKAAVDNVKLKLCACLLVKYCSVECQKNHRPQHKKACKKRLAEIRDNELFEQPDITHYGECPLCCLPLLFDKKKTVMKFCCSKLICKGCSHANITREIEQGLEHKCPFCRESTVKSCEESEQYLAKRVEAQDPFAMSEMGKTHYHRGDYEGAFQHWRKAAELGDTESHFQLAGLYGEGEGVERDLKKKMYHMEQAAIGGHPGARYNLGCIEGRNGRVERAMKHWMIAAKLGFSDALEPLKQGFQNGAVSKGEYDSALRGHQTAVDATKSAQREKAYKLLGK